MAAVKIVFTPSVINAVRAVWNEIGSDSIACAQECGEDMTNEAALEGVLDADRMTTFGYPDADKEVSALIKAHSYQKVMRALKTQVKLM